MRSLGDIFRKKLEDRQYEVKPEYWSDMEKLLDKNPSKKDWVIGKLGLSVFTASLFITGTAVYLLKPSDSNQSTKVIKKTSEVLKTSDVSIGNTNSTLTKKQESEKNTEKHSAENKTQINQSEKIIIEKKQIDSDVRVGSDSKQTTMVAEKTSEILKASNVLNEISVDQDLSATTSLEKDRPTDISGNTVYPIPDYPVPVTNDHLPLTDLQLMKLLLLTEITQQNSNTNVLPTQDKTNTYRKKLKMYAGLYGGILYAGKWLKSSGSGYDEYISRRKNEEMGMISFTSGINMGIQNGRWNIGTGIGYHRQGEITDYKPEFLRWIAKENISWNITDNSYWLKKTTDYRIVRDNNYWTTKDTTLFYWNESIQSLDTATVSQQIYVVSNIDTLNVNRTDSFFIQKIDSIKIVSTDSSLQKITDDGIGQKKEYNKITYIEIPFLIGYEFPVGCLTLTARAGIGLGMLAMQKTTYLKTDLSNTETVNVSNLNKIMLNYLAQVNVNYYLNQHIALSAEPNFRINLNTIFSTPNDIQQKYWNIGLNCGVLYRF